ncbi:DUF3108 domain-containing protein [Lacinutrix sp. Bg11-31]|uniref:DUF3108 domain-containing protein n=1 Tax=Lacinutrix sp. Bg11-31 TaxID=2057808 RepID=UPI000C311ED4|nr:DUF3108 domain-containing protein [Lacinutrix sp. Bg11-31]AUC81101.1 DUF3108 domain-containing protein [Lacinutrix sp. Bg11-31]
MKHYFLFLALSLSLFTSAQNNAFLGGENLTFTAGYNMSGLMTDFAEVTMATSNVNTKSGTLLRLKCKATTYTKWDNFFKIRDLYESYVNPRTLTPYLYKRDINEGGHYTFVKYNFNHKSRSVKSLIRKKSKNFTSGFWDRKTNVKINGNTKDIVTTIYHLRTLDIKKASIGDSDTFTVLFDNEQTKFRFTYVAKETINTAIGKKECYKLRINLDNNDALKGNSNFLWLTADENKVPVYAKFKVAIGSGELKIKSATGLKN